MVEPSEAPIGSDCVGSQVDMGGATPPFLRRDKGEVFSPFRFFVEMDGLVHFFFEIAFDLVEFRIQGGLFNDGFGFFLEVADLV